MNKIVCILITSIALMATGQQVFAQKIMTRTGHIWFSSHTPIEDIEAHNHQAMSVLNTQSGDVAFAVLIKGFQFEKALMQEHFNEKYMESDTYPKSTFAGSITNLSDISLDKDGEYTAQAKGTLTIHGVGKEVETTGMLTVTEGKVMLKANFPVELADYEINIPSVVRDNIAKTINISIDLSYE
ncbi:MAG: YceI family protein [Bacteroidota bacterium]